MSHCLNAGGMGRIDYETETMIVTSGVVSPTLVPVGVTIHGTDPTVQKVASYDELAQCLRARTPGNIDNSSTTVVLQPVANGAQFIHCNKGRPAGRLSKHTATVAIKHLVETLTTNGHQQSAVFTPAMQVRRLTPTEAERLQGFEPGYTAIPWRGKPADQCPDGPRYKALGNSMAVPVMRWIGQSIDYAMIWSTP